MKVYMVEWWSDRDGKWLQEYYTSIRRVALRVEMLEADVPNSRPDVDTLLVDTTP